MSIGLFIDGAYVYKGFPGQMDYVKLRQVLETELADVVDEGYFFNADDDPPKAQKLRNKVAYPPPSGPGLGMKIYWLSKRKHFWPQKYGGGPVMHPTAPNVQFEVVSQKAVDVGLVFHLTRSFLKRGWKKLVLAAGDGDFYEPIQSPVENENVDLYLVGTLDTISQDLRPYARKIYEIDKEPLLSRLRLQGQGFQPNISTDG